MRKGLQEGGKKEWCSGSKVVKVDCEQGTLVRKFILHDNEFHSTYIMEM